MNSQQDVWNESTKTIPLDRDPSTYAIEKEKLFPRESIVCDLGGGSGADSIYFLLNGHSVTLVDISDLGLERTRLKAEVLGLVNKLIIIQKDLSEGNLPIKSDYCDIVYSRMALHYFSQSRTIELLKQVFRILKKGGISYITIKSPKDLREMQFLKSTAKEVENEVFVDEGQTKARFSMTTITDMLKKAGINNFEIKDYLENFSGRIDRVKSGANSLILTEIIIKK
jgi:ubiquinone/menaquinone biosynthesis C-methylase UbiE